MSKPDTAEKMATLINTLVILNIVEVLQQMGIQIASKEELYTHQHKDTETDKTKKISHNDLIDVTPDQHHTQIHGTSDHDNTISKKRRIDIPFELAYYSASGTVTYDLRGRTIFNKADWDKISAIYFEAFGNCANDTDSMTVTLYDYTHSTEIASLTFEGTALQIKRTSDIKDSIPSGDITLGVRVSTTTSIRYRGSRLIIIQQE